MAPNDECLSCGYHPNSGWEALLDDPDGEQSSTTTS